MGTYLGTLKWSQSRRCWTENLFFCNHYKNSRPNIMSGFTHISEEFNIEKRGIEWCNYKSKSWQTRLKFTRSFYSVERVVRNHSSTSLYPEQMCLSQQFHRNFPSLRYSYFHIYALFCLLPIFYPVTKRMLLQKLDRYCCSVSVQLSH